MRIYHRSLIQLFPLLLAVDSGWARPTPQSSAITYQGRLTFNGQPATTTYDFECRLFDAEVGGNQVGPLITPGSIEADDSGIFTMTLDFGALAFDGSERWLQLGVRESGGGPTFTPLTPRQKIEAAPYAAFALRSGLSGTYGEAVTLSNPANAITGAFSGSGAGLSNLNAGAISGIINSANISGSYANAITLNNAANVFTGSGAGLTALNATSITSGTLSVARLPSSGNWPLSSNLTLDTDLLFINPTNNLVGIGTTSPGATLEVARSVAGNINPTLLLRQTGTASSSSMRYMNSSGNHFNLGITAANEFAIGYNANVPLAGDLVRLTSTGNMGIGTTAPAAKLHVNGDARIDGSIAIATATRTKTISAAAFAASSPITTPLGYTLGQTGLILAGSETATFRASLELPDGATLLDIDMVIVDDSDQQDMSVGAIRTPFDGTPAVSIGTNLTSGSATLPQLVNTLTAPIVIDNVNNAYHVLASWTGPSGPTGGVLRLYAARFTYTIDQPLP